MTIALTTEPALFAGALLALTTLWLLAGALRLIATAARSGKEITR